MQQKHKDLIMWAGITGGIIALVTTTMQVAYAVKNGGLGSYLTKLKGG